MHKNKIVHRDLKPENILLVEKEDQTTEVKICDLGLAIKLESNKRAFAVCGTPGFIAPEILIGLGHTEKADIFSLGSIMFTLLTGTNLINGETTGDLLERNQHFKVCNLEQTLEGISA
mmetsp:Transcript_339/g.373  ORF Transcript_339/g.373 Transcript_339/m.373 type:complete len:118 (-) Transcript_339:220-573(-)